MSYRDRVFGGGVTIGAGFSCALPTDHSVRPFAGSCAARLDCTVHQCARLCGTARRRRFEDLILVSRRLTAAQPAAGPQRLPMNVSVSDRRFKGRPSPTSCSGVHRLEACDDRPHGSASAGRRGARSVGEQLLRLRLLAVEAAGVGVSEFSGCLGAFAPAMRAGPWALYSLSHLGRQNPPLSP
jgi:hypothetical protein